MLSRALKNLRKLNRFRFLFCFGVVEGESYGDLGSRDELVTQGLQTLQRGLDRLSGKEEVYKDGT